MRRWIVALLVIVLVLLQDTGVLAEENASHFPSNSLIGAGEPGVGLLRYTATASLTASLSISGGKAACYGKVVPSNGSYSCSIVVTLYQSTEAGGWTKVDAWSDSGSGTSGASAGDSVSVPSGYDYKVVSSATVKDADGNVLERPTKTSAIKSY